MICLLPIDKHKTAKTVAVNITAGIGHTTFAANMLIAAEARAPKPICKAPINADALPAFFLNGAKDNAEALGLIKPKQAKNKLNKVFFLTTYFMAPKG